MITIAWIAIPDSGLAREATEFLKDTSTRLQRQGANFSACARVVRDAACREPIRDLGRSQ
jgi:hypothetical protein